MGSVFAFDSALGCAAPVEPRALAPAQHDPLHPKETAIYHVMQSHLAAFLASWAHKFEGRTLPRFVTDELRAFLTCGIPAHGFAQLYCDTFKARHIVAFSCKGCGFCPRCSGHLVHRLRNAIKHSFV